MLSNHFSWEEAERSSTADAKGINNHIPAELKPNVQQVADAMELVRSLLGSHPLKINSWYRCSSLNSAIGGSSKSAHMKGLAVDFEPTTMSNDAAFKLIADSTIEFDQLIHERTKSGADWIHFGLNDKPARREVLTASGNTLGGPMQFTRIALG